MLRFLSLLSFLLILLVTALHTDSHRGFGFVEFEMVEDANAAIDNMVCCKSDIRTAVKITLKHYLNYLKIISSPKQQCVDLNSAIYVYFLA